MVAFWFQKNYVWFTQAMMESIGRKQCWSLNTELSTFHIQGCFSEKKNFIVYFLEVSTVLFPSPDMHLSATVFSKHNFSVCSLSVLCSLCTMRFSYSWTICSFSLFWFLPFASMQSPPPFLPLFYPCSLDSLFLYSLSSLSSSLDHGITSPPPNINSVLKSTNVLLLLPEGQSSSL